MEKDGSTSVIKHRQSPVFVAILSHLNVVVVGPYTSFYFVTKFK